MCTYTQAQKNPLTLQFLEFRIVRAETKVADSQKTPASREYADRILLAG